MADGANIPRPSTVASVAPLASVNSSAEPIHRSVRVVACVPVTRRPASTSKTAGIASSGAPNHAASANAARPTPRKPAPSAAAVATQVAATQGDTQRAADTGTPATTGNSWNSAPSIAGNSMPTASAWASASVSGAKRSGKPSTGPSANSKPTAAPAHGTGSRQPNTTPGAGMRS
ncbi:hypothetical protein [Ralstonia pseudosolanacearum]|uniref:hypothetical protein n=1 Tax=Ralstonia pseudosolanacearum TaxID=1310165 RepID=UPI001FFA00D5|nr:hypothetical protein [Ralstonia pseudosolanacearum]